MTEREIFLQSTRIGALIPYKRCKIGDWWSKIWFFCIFLDTYMAIYKFIKEGENISVTQDTKLVIPTLRELICVYTTHRNLYINGKYIFLNTLRHRYHRGVTIRVRTVGQNQKRSHRSISQWPSLSSSCFLLSWWRCGDGTSRIGQRPLE